MKIFIAMLYQKDEILKIENFEYFFLNSLSKRPTEYDNFETDSQKIVTNLSNKKFGVLFPYYWTHNQVKKFGETYKISIDDYTWYLEQLKKYVLSGELDYIDRINLFHCFGFIRYFKEDEKIYLISNILEYKLNKDFQFSSLSNISAFTLLNFIAKFDKKDLIPYLQKMSNNPQLLEFYAKYQIFYYGGFKNCLHQLREYQERNDIRGNVIPQTLLALKITEKYVNFDEIEEFRDEYDYLFEKLPSNIKKWIQ